jgi:hypothetical protein
MHKMDTESPPFLTSSLQNNNMITFINLYLSRSSVIYRFSPSIFFYLGTTLPCIWWLELGRLYDKKERQAHIHDSTNPNDTHNSTTNINLFTQVSTIQLCKSTFARTRGFRHCTSDGLRVGFRKIVCKWHWVSNPNACEIAIADALGIVPVVRIV